MSLLRQGLSLVWEAPQTALGAAMLGAEAARKRIVQIEVEDGRLVVESKGTGISLGHVVFWSRENSRWHDLDVRNRAHELGQYYEGYPENWADRLGGVIREKEQA
ncbi:MAG: hypothetical protein JRF42_14240 [Deltaproteobacteria bacterium]|nr:hypothetical protein [Deltaproteobacteria bacterium]